MTIKDKLLHGKVMDVLDQIEALADEDLDVAHILARYVGKHAEDIDFNLSREAFSQALDKASDGVEKQLELRDRRKA